MSVGRLNSSLMKSKPMSERNARSYVHEPLRGSVKNCMGFFWPIMPCACSCMKLHVRLVSIPIASALRRACSQYCELKAKRGGRKDRKFQVWHNVRKKKKEE